MHGSKHRVEAHDHHLAHVRSLFVLFLVALLQGHESHDFRRGDVCHFVQGAKGCVSSGSYHYLIAQHRFREKNQIVEDLCVY